MLGKSWKAARSEHLSGVAKGWAVGLMLLAAAPLAQAQGEPATKVEVDAEASVDSAEPAPPPAPTTPEPAPSADGAPPPAPAEGDFVEVKKESAGEYTGYAPQSGGTPQQPLSEPDKAELSVSMGGGLILLFGQPLPGKGDNFFEIFEARLRLDAQYERFRVHITPRFRNTKERAFFPGISWVEEGYIGAEFGPTILKAGKIYRQFGRFWDNSFMGNVQEYDGLKLDMNHGLSFEGTLGKDEPLGLTFAAQYFVVDGTTNYALPGRDTPTLPGARRRNQVVLRGEPSYKLNNAMTVKAGLSLEYFQADMPDPFETEDVARVALDATFEMPRFTAWAEFTQQWGRHVLSFPITGEPDADGNPVGGQSSNNVSYLLLGGEFTYDIFTFRYNFSMGSYNEVDATEMRHVPGFGITPNDFVMLLLEYSGVVRTINGETDLVAPDSGVYLTLHAKF